jgi:hypothetical protein
MPSLSESEGIVVKQILELADTFFNERLNFRNVIWCDSADAGVDMETRNQVVVGQINLLDRVVTLKVQYLIEAGGDVATRDTFNRRGRKIDTADNEVTRILSC